MLIFWHIQNEYTPWLFFCCLYKVWKYSWQIWRWLKCNHKIFWPFFDVQLCFSKCYSIHLMWFWCSLGIKFWNFIDIEPSLSSTLSSILSAKFGSFFFVMKQSMAAQCPTFPLCRQILKFNSELGVYRWKRDRVRFWRSGISACVDFTLDVFLVLDRRSVGFYFLYVPWDALPRPELHFLPTEESRETFFPSIDHS